MTFEQFLLQVKIFEGFRPNKYKCPSGVDTIGYGFTASCFSSGIPNYITKESADALLEILVNEVKSKVKKSLDKWGYIYTYNQLLALTDFTYNCGVSNLNKLTANGTRTLATIGEKILLYNKSNGKTLNGLVKRREWEHELFFTQSTKSEITQPTVKDIQHLLNSKFNKNLVEDNKIGNKTLKAIYEVLTKI